MPEESPDGWKPIPPPLVEEPLARDTQSESVVDHDDSPINSPPGSLLEHSLSNFYRRPSFVSGTHPTVVPSPVGPNRTHLSPDEHRQMIREERSLLKDNHLIPRSNREGSSGSVLSHRVSLPGLFTPKSNPDEERGDSRNNERLLDETTPLLGGVGGVQTPDSIEVAQKWEDAVMAGLIQTTWQRETKVLVRNSTPMIITFLLQYSLIVASIFAVGHIGKVELGAVSLATSK
jgi:MATE family multidrug resistance protein